MERIFLPLIIPVLITPLLFAQDNPDAILPLDPDTAKRCVPADITYTHFGAVDEKTLIMTNQDNETIVATLRNACPRLLDESRVLLQFRKGDGLSRLGSRMCADDAFMLIEAEAVSVNNGDSLRACEFRAFYDLPFEVILNTVKTNDIFFRGMGTM